MRTLAAIVANQILAASGSAVFERLHETLNKIEHIVDDAQPILTDMKEDLHDFSHTLHDKAHAYHTLVDDLWDNIKGDKAEEDTLKGTIVNQSIKKNDFGCTVDETVYDSMYVETVITAPALPYSHDYVQQAEQMDKAAAFHQDLRESNSDPQPIMYNCDNREPEGTPVSVMSFLPALAADLSEKNPKATYKGHCFLEITLELTNVQKTSFDVIVTTAHPTGPFCSDVFLFANAEITHTHMFYVHGTHKLTFQIPTADEQADFNFNGIAAFAFCEGLLPTVGAIWNTFKSAFGGCELGPCKPNLPFIGMKVPDYMEKATVNFLEQSMQIKMEKRDIKRVHIDPNTIQSGDFIAVNRLTGPSQLISYGTGSHISHCTMALWMDGELYVVESTSGAYYDPSVVQGVMKTKWAEWIQLQDDTSCQVLHLPLKPELAKKFDADKAIEYFNAHEGLPYGFHNFLYGWVDTPDADWPPLLPESFAPVLFSIVERFAPKTAFNFFTQALNKRMGIMDESQTPMNITEIAVAAAAQNMRIEDVMAMPEIDGWEYYGEGARDGESMVCSVLVTALYKAGGLYDDLEINATEFHPLDAYSMNFYDLDYKRPQACIDADPNLPYCQLTGNYRIELPTYSTIEPYARMNERCAVHWPSYSRDDGC